MPSLADLPELIGLLSYSVDDAAHFLGALSRLRAAIQRELEGQLGRSENTVRLYSLRSKILIERSVFFIPVITPTALGSDSWRQTYLSILARETALKRIDLVFPILLTDVPNLDWSLVGTREYLDWRHIHLTEVGSAEVMGEVRLLCKRVVVALTAPWQAPPKREQAVENPNYIQLPKKQIVSRSSMPRRREYTLLSLSNSYAPAPPRVSSAERSEVDKQALPRSSRFQAAAESLQLD
jgi:hypothetical protein